MRNSPAPETKRLPRFLSAFQTGLEIAGEVRRSFSTNGGFNQAASLSFFVILSIIPFIFLLLSFSGFLAGWIPRTQEVVLSFLDRSFPYARDLFFHEIDKLIQNKGLFGTLGLVSLLWTASLIFSSLERAFQVIFRSRRRRSYLRSKLLSFLMIPLGAMVFLLSILSSWTVQWIGRIEFQGGGLQALFPFVERIVMGYVLPLILLGLFFALVFKVIPGVPIPMGQALITGLSCGACIVLANQVFAWYLNHAARYSVVYGSMGAVIVFLLWYYYISIIILLCGEFLIAYRRRNLILLKKAFL